MHGQQNLRICVQVGVTYTRPLSTRFQNMSTPLGWFQKSVGDGEGIGGQCEARFEWAAVNCEPVDEILSKIKASAHPQPRRSEMQDLSSTYTRDAK